MKHEYTPTQLLYDKVFELLKGYGIDVIDVKDIADEIPYPFFVVNKFKIAKTSYTLQTYHGVLTGAIHIWSESNDLGKHDNCIAFVERLLSSPILIQNYQVRLKELLINTIDDNSADTLLLHTIVNVEFEIL
ncbi:TPA: hypothetical protein ACHAOB_000966 [Staphylococcus aureus]